MIIYLECKIRANEKICDEFGGRKKSVFTFVDWLPRMPNARRQPGQSLPYGTTLTRDRDFKFMSKKIRSLNTAQNEMQYLLK